ncbi:MAG TPA: TonB-dependent receptor plug domain-containing protein [Candidatus Didemnitutus sp.]|nr:TonB-dependent receptor plug domain-containing protein [Candidatus Didemnitutus sp.]
MKRLPARVVAYSAATAFCFAAALRLSAQTAAPAPDTKSADKEKEDTVVLSPFVVEATEDQGYSAKDTLAGTRVRTELKDVASSISVVTKQFLQDTASHNNQDLLVYTPNTEVGGLHGNFSGQGGNIVYNEPLGNPNGNTRVRGLDSADNTRDYFLTDIPWDNFNVERIDLQRGPNSTLFGVGSPAGIINASLNPARFKNSYKYENVTSSYNSQRNLVDFNQVILNDTLALRFAALSDRQKFQQDPAFNNTTRYYGALRFDPKLFTVANSHTSLRANYEHGDVDSNNPRTLPPDDQITPWFVTGTDAYGQPGLNKITINEYQPGQGPNSALVNSTLNRTSWAQGRTYWPTPIVYFNGSDPSTPGVMPAVASGLPTQVIIGEMTTGWAINAAGQIAPPNQPGQSTNLGIGGLPNFQPKAVPNFQHYASGALKGGSFYANKSLTDSSIFDFYNKLLDGPNKHEWQKWDAFNIALSQTFWDDRVGFELAYNEQKYEQGQVGFLGGENYAINIDVNQVLADGSKNPNVGRPYVANAAESGNQSQKTKRDSTRLTGFGEARFTDWMGNTTLARILGRHVFTGLLGLDHKEQQNVSWSQYAADTSYETLNNYDLSVKISNYRLYNWVNYIGPSLGGASSASGANLTNIRTMISPPSTSNVRWFDSHWKYPLTPGAPGYVDPSAPYTFVNNDTGAVTNSNQANNPANYVGWSSLPVKWMNANNAQDFPSMVTGGSKNKYRNESQVLVWQGYLFNEDLVGTYSWRKDKIRTYNTGAPIDGATAVAALDYSDDPASLKEAEGQTRTWGVVGHVPKSIMKHLPGDMGVSLFYNDANNFKADTPRTNFAGQQIPNPDGITKEYGAALTIGDKLTFKATHYETTVHYATLSNNAVGALGGNSYLLYLAPAWGYGYASMVQAGLDGKFGNTTLNGPGDTAGGTSWNYVARDAIINDPNADMSVIGTPAGAATKPVATYGYGGTGNVSMTDIVNAWLKLPVPDNFFDYWGITGNRPQPAKARATGKLYDGWSQPFISGGVVGVGVGGQQPSGSQNPVSTVDNISEGWEFELTAQPIKNWNITVNYSKTEATKTNIDAITQKFMADNLAFYQGAGGQLRLWGASQTAGYGPVNNPGGNPLVYTFVKGQTNGSAVGPQWIAGVYNPYLVTALSQGLSAPEVSPWRLNLITTYSFDRGPVKGMFVGGAMRMEAGRILGYQLDPVTVVLDPTKPYYGPDENHYDLWVGYSTKFTFSRKVNWRIQLNLRNVGENSSFTPISYHPDGKIAGARIVEGMTWALTNSFEF